VGLGSRHFRSNVFSRPTSRRLATLDLSWAGARSASV
jgi:hypothetical protein